MYQYTGVLLQAYMYIQHPVYYPELLSLCVKILFDFPKTSSSFNPFNPKLIMQILLTIQEENDRVM